MRKLTPSSKSLQLEVEATLIVCSDNPSEVVREISDLASIGEFLLIPETKQEIYDLYFDTPDRALRAKKIALRVRSVETNGKKHTELLTLKGPSKPHLGGSEVERLEIELDWSKDAIDDIFKRLKIHGIRLNPIMPQALDYLNPIVTLEMMGLGIIQNRKTSRTIRNVFPKEGLCSAVAELAIDEGAYYIRGQYIRYSEIEIEAKLMDSSIALNVLVQKLLEKFGDRIHQWKYSKLAMGMAIEDLIVEKGINSIVDNVGYLTPKAYRMIKAHLEKD